MWVCCILACKLDREGGEGDTVSNLTQKMYSPVGRQNQLRGIERLFCVHIRDAHSIKMVLQLAVSRGLKALGLLREQTMLTPECNLQVTAKNAALKRQCNATVDLRSSFLLPSCSSRCHLSSSSTSREEMAA